MCHFHAWPEKASLMIHLFLSFPHCYLNADGQGDLETDLKDFGAFVSLVPK